MLKQTTQTTQSTQHFIADRALSLAYEAVQFPATASVSLAWINRARLWAEHHRLYGLKDDLLSVTQSIENIGEEIERPCPHCGLEMEEGIIGATCSGGSHREVNGFYCETCGYTETEDGHAHP